MKYAIYLEHINEPLMEIEAESETEALTKAGEAVALVGYAKVSGCSHCTECATDQINHMENELKGDNSNG